MNRQEGRPEKRTRIDKRQDVPPASTWTCTIAAVVAPEAPQTLRRAATGLVDDPSRQRRGGTNARLRVDRYDGRQDTDAKETTQRAPTVMAIASTAHTARSGGSLGQAASPLPRQAAATLLRHDDERPPHPHSLNRASAATRQRRKSAKPPPPARLGGQSGASVAAPRERRTTTGPLQCAATRGEAARRWHKTGHHANGGRRTSQTRTGSRRARERLLQRTSTRQQQISCRWAPTRWGPPWSPWLGRTHRVGDQHME